MAREREGVARRPAAAFDGEDLVRRLAEIWINRSNRQGYQRACGHLVRMRYLSRLLGLESECDGYLAGLRIRFPKRPALHEELSRFGI